MGGPWDQLVCENECEIECMLYSEDLSNTTPPAS